MQCTPRLILNWFTDKHSGMMFQNGSFPGRKRLLKDGGVFQKNRLPTPSASCPFASSSRPGAGASKDSDL